MKEKNQYNMEKISKKKTIEWKSLKTKKERHLEKKEWIKTWIEQEKREEKLWKKHKVILKR